jgi:threonine dehydrogenase-like Zn-dependent dehydrogenase
MSNFENQKMVGVWLENRRLSVREDLPIPQPAPGEALIKVRLAGICATDLELMRGYYPYTGIMGHEFVGEVVQSNGDQDWIGKRVVGEINITCGECAACRAGRSNHCEQRSVLGIVNAHGSFAEYTKLPLRNLHQVPENVPDEMAVFTEPLAAALRIQEQAHIGPSQRVLVIGAGRLGQLIAQSLALSGCRLSVVVRHAKQQQLLAMCGVSCLMEEETGSQSWDIVVEATGSPDGFNLALLTVRPGGMLVLKSTFAGHTTANLSAVVVDEITLLGSRCGPFAPALRLMEKNLVRPQLLIEKRYPLNQAAQSIEYAAQAGVLKVLIEPGN